MDDLIHRADAVEALRDALSDLTLSHREHKMTMQCLDDLPTVEPRAKGHWIELPGVIGVAYCSECNYQLTENNTNFCPNCGADMRGEEE